MLPSLNWCSSFISKCLFSVQSADILPRSSATIQGMTNTLLHHTDIIMDIIITMRSSTITTGHNQHCSEKANISILTPDMGRYDHLLLVPYCISNDVKVWPFFVRPKTFILYKSIINRLHFQNSSSSVNSIR